jgi:uncharacterized lipoprotein
MTRLAVVFGVLLLAGCSGRYCERSAPVYEEAVESAPLKAPDGLSVPKPDPNLVIPEATGPDTPYASKEAKGKRAKCLDMPPEMPKEAPKEAPAPAAS